MAESNATQVILTDDGLKIIKAQDTADEVAGNVNDINSDNKLTPSEKLKLKQEYDKDVELYNIDIEQLKSVDLPTAELETAMSNLTDFVTPLFKEMNRTSTVDRDTLDSVFTAFATADKNASQAFVNMVQQVADDAKKAGDDAKEVGEKAQEAGKEAKASADQAQADASQAKVDAAAAQNKAQSSIDQLNEAKTQINSDITDAKNNAQKALDNITVVDSKVTKLSDSTTAQFNTLNNGYQEVISTVNNMDIGAVNLLRCSRFAPLQKPWQSAVAVKDCDAPMTVTDGSKAVSMKASSNIEGIGSKDSGKYFRYDAPSVEKDVVYTFSAWVKVEEEGTFGFVAESNGTRFNFNVNKTWTLVHGQLTFQADNRILFIYQTTAGSPATFALFHPKLEKGNKATDWSPATEDLASQTQITTLNNLINQKVSNDQYQSDKTQTADLISQTVTSAVSNISVGGTNLLKNSKFDDTMNNWRIWCPQVRGTSTVEIDPTGGGGDWPRQAIYSAKIINPEADKNNIFGIAQDSVPVEPSTEYVLQLFNDGSDPITLQHGSGTGDPFIKQVVSDHKAVWKFKTPADTYTTNIYIGFDSGQSGTAWISLTKLEKGNKPTDWSLSPFDTATSTEIDQLNNAIRLKADSSDVTSQINVATKGVQSEVDNKISGLTTQINQTSDAVRILNANAVSQSDITASIDNIHLGVKNADGSTSTFNMNGNTILMDTAQTIINGKTSILDASIDTAKIANAAINTAQIADGAINNAKIANASIDDAKISNLNGNKLIENSITANKINVDDLIANGINTKTLTSVNLNTSTLTTPQLDLGLNGTFTEDFDYTQATSMFLPKKNKGTLTFDHGSLQSKGNMQTYVGGQWGGMNDDYTFQAGIDNSQWTEVAPGYIKLDLFKQNDADVGQRTYIDPTGYYYTSRNGIASYLGNVLQTPQVQTSSVLTKYIGTSDGKSLLQISSNGDHYGLQVGPYAGNEAVLSDFIYDSTTSGAPNVNITANGHLVRSTSASKYKYNIKNPDIETTLGDRLLNVHLATWNDKRAVDLYAEQLSTGEEREKSSIDKYYGLIAEQLRDAGLDMFISYGKNHEIEGIQYDRAWVPLLSVIRRLNDKVNEYEFRLSKLEGASK
ncbi:hypothetical protein [Pediococcus pentosaceus]|uniref:hypothetical protein n=1 Tax=Pediococcus pentosaceus TaxID=1255 RepID=UPI0039ECF722